ncbi:UDP-3-O-(3-hydroxymyristoyl)glucosamine N-acyltransferase [Planctomycetota bacterium]
MQNKTLAELAEHVGGRIIGDENVKITHAATLENAISGQISFLANAKYEPLLKTTKASAVIVGKEHPGIAPSLLIADDPYYAFMRIMVLLYGHRRHKKTGISTKANIAATAKIGDNCDIHDFVTIDENAKVGDNCKIYPGVYIGPDAQLGNDCIIYPNVTIYDGCRIGNRVIINAGASICQDGFGFATHKGIHHKIPHAGIVIIEDDVEIGSCCTIERGTLENTVIGTGSKLGDLVAIGHGTIIGPHCLLVPQVGVAGSATLGHHCVLAGQVGVAGHIKIGNMVKVGAQSGISNNVPDGATLFGTPAFDANKAKRAYTVLRQLPDMKKTIRELEKRLKKLEENQTD